jgi:1-phosphofructokinase
MKQKIITIGISPAWDRTIEIAGVDWGEHKIISTQKITPAGKALNISRALSQMGEKSIAAGLWGGDDWGEMEKATADLKKSVQFKFTKAAGRTRTNLTVVDTAKKRQMHLRSKSTIADEKSLSALNRNLQKIVTKNSVCIFAGTMPGGKLLNKTISLIETAKKKRALVIIDSSGEPFRKVLAKGGLFLIKPNIEELGELVGRKIPNKKNDVIGAAKKLLGKTEFVLVSMAEKGAILVGREIIISARYEGKKFDVYNTVGCGDYLLAGFTAEICKTGNLNAALQKAVAMATAKASGFRLNS